MKQWECNKDMFMFIEENQLFTRGKLYDEIRHTPLTLKDDMGVWQDITDLKMYFKEVKSKKERKLKVGGLYPIKTTYEVLVYKYKGFKNGEHIFLDTQDVGVIVFEDTIKHRVGKRIKFK